MSESLGKGDLLNSSIEAWDTYTQRLEQYIIVNEINDKKKRVVLLSEIGTKTYNLLCSLTPVKPADKTFAEIVAFLQKSPLSNTTSDHRTFLVFQTNQRVN